MTAGLATCIDCGLTYDLDRDGDPATADPFTCDDCGGYVEPDTNGPMLAQYLRDAITTPTGALIVITVLALIGFALDPGHGMP